MSVFGDRPLWVTEIGGENGGVFTLGDPRAVQLIRKSAMIAAACGTQSAIYYGHINPTDATANLGDPANSAAVSEALGQMQALAGKTIFRATERTDGEIVLEFSDGMILRSSTGLFEDAINADVGVQQTQPLTTATATNAPTIALSADVRAGSMLVLVGTGVKADFDALIVNTVTDTQGNEWGVATNTRTAGSYVPNQFAIVARNVAAGPTTITIDTNGASTGNRISAALIEIRDAGAVVSVRTGDANNATNTATSSGTGTLDQSDNVAIVVAGGYFGLPGNPSGWTNVLTQQNGANIGCQISYQRLNSTASISGVVPHSAATAPGASGVILLVANEVAQENLGALTVTESGRDTVQISGPIVVSGLMAANEERRDAVQMFGEFEQGDPGNGVVRQRLHSRAAYMFSGNDREQIPITRREDRKNPNRSRSVGGRNTKGWF